MSVHVSSLPTAILTEIWNYCEAKDIEALRCTCHRFKTLIEKTMLVINGEFGCGGTTRQIPVFDKDHCHSVFLICKLRPQRYFCGHTIVVESRSKRNYGRSTTVVRQQIVHTGPRLEMVFLIGFRNDPFHDYQLSHGCPDHSNEGPIVTVRKQFMRRPVTPTRTRAIADCLAIEQTRAVPNDARYISRPDALRLFMKLFVLSCASSSSEVSSPIHKFFTQGRYEANPDSNVAHRIVNFFERILEQKEPMDCVKRPLTLRNGIERIGYVYDIQLYHLNKEFTWKCDEENYSDEKEGIRFHDGLEFIARIPLTRKTIALHLKPIVDADSHVPLFIVFFKKRQRSRSLGNPISHVFTGQPFLPSRDKGRSFAMEPGYEECFLYFVPNNASRIVIKGINARLGIAVDEHSWEFKHWLELLLGPCCNSMTSAHKHQLPLKLFRASALALLGPNAQRYTAWKEAFDTEKLDSTPDGLQCIVETAKELLRCGKSF